MFFKLLKKIPKEIRIIALFTSILYLGRWFFEAYLPIFLSSFANTHAETGMLKSIYDVIFFLVAPIAWYFADRISAKKIILLWLCCYPLISLSYFFAGITYLAIFIVIARIINGFAYGTIAASRQKLMYQFWEWEIGKSMWFFDSMTNRTWIIWVFISMILVRRVPIHMLALAIIPASVVAFFVAKRLPDTKKVSKHISLNFRIYLDIFKNIKRRDPKLRKLIFLWILITMVSASFYFFIPIEVYSQWHSLLEIWLLTICFTLPESLGLLFGRKIDVDHGRWFIRSCVAIIITLVLSLFMKYFVWYILAGILIGVAIEIMELERHKLIAALWNNGNYWEINGIKVSMEEWVGMIFWPILIWLFMDIWGMQLWFAAMIVLIIIILCIFSFSILPAYANRK